MHELLRQAPARAGDVWRRGLAAAGAGIGAAALHRREVIIEPARQLDVPGDRGLGQGADILDQPGGKQPPPAVVAEAVGQAAPVELIQVRSPPGVVGIGEPPGQDVAGAGTAQGRALPGAAPPGDDLVVDLLGGLAAQRRVVERAVRQVANLHLGQPAVDHEVAGHVPQPGIAAAAAGVMPQPGVQQFVRDHEPALAVLEAAQRIDVQLGGGRADRRGPDAVRAAHLGVLDQLERGGEPAEQRVGGDEPAERLTPLRLAARLAGQALS